MEVSCLLDGEATRITIKIASYVMETEQEKKLLRASAFRCTRRWMQSLLTDFGHRKRIETIPQLRPVSVP